MSHYVFVYGSLKSGYGNHPLLVEGDAKFLGEAETAMRYKMLSLGGFPGVVEGGDDSIKGEVYEVDDDTFRSLDFLEGYPSFYTRKQVEVHDGTLAWMYILAKPEQYDDCEQVVDGVW